MRFQKQQSLCGLATSLLVFFLLLGFSPAQENRDETYSISLVQTAEVDKQIVEIEGQKVLTESCAVKKGDHLWQLLRERGLIEKRNLSQLLAVLKTLNKDLENLDLIHPGQKIIIPLIISPLQGVPQAARKPSEKAIPFETLKGVDLENYTVQPGDSVIKVVRDRFGVPTRELHNEYLEMVKRLNPSIRDLNVIYPDQVIRLPIYSPQVVRAPIKPSPPRPPETYEPKASSKVRTALKAQLGDIFTELGEEWVGTGEHFIPLKAGGEVNLNADSFPVINLLNGNRIVVDLNHDLPDKMARMIVSSWSNYRIVHLAREDDLRSALGKILPLCDYSKLFGLNEPLELGGDIPVRITSDWIVQSTAESVEQGHRVFLVTISDNPASHTPKDIENFLNTLGIKVIDYPQEKIPGNEEIGAHEVLSTGPDLDRLVEHLLRLTGKNFSSKVEIPIFQNRETSFNLIVKADFLLSIDGVDSIIDLTGLGDEIVSLLREHKFSVLSLSDEKNPSVVASRTFDFLHTAFDPGPHVFTASSGPGSKNIRITVPGITFRTHDGQDIFATPLNLPDGLVSFLSRKGYKILGLALS